ncbi:MAG: thioesterase family protein [Steroidobacteraceae bacterium]
MKPIPNGAQGRYVHRVESAHLANRFKDAILPPVFSTPYLILVMENAALNAIKQYLEEGESAVGTRVDVRHLVATPVGREVVGHAEVTGTEGRKVFFRVWATDGEEQIGAGTHERMVVNSARIVERMAAKYVSVIRRPSSTPSIER